MGYYKTVLGVDEETKTMLLYLKSILEPRVGKVISFSKLVKLLSEFVSQCIENDDFEKEFVDFAKVKLNASC